MNSWKWTLLALLASVCLVGSEPIALGQVESGPIVHWTFDEGSGTTALDSSGNNHAGTISGATYVPGRFDSALSFNGTNHYVFASDGQPGGVTGGGLDMGARDWTVAARINTTASGMVVTKMGFVGGANPDGWGMSVSANGTVGAVLHKSGAGTVNIFSGDGTTVNDGQWHHLAVVFNRAANMIRYVDGAPSGTQNSLAFLGGQSLDNVKQLRIGARDQSGDEIFFNGLIDDVRVYARALSGEEIAALAGVEPPKPPLWSAPVALVSAYGRVAVGNRVHVVGHSSGNLVHRSSQDSGVTWGTPSIIASASGNYPMQYGGLFAVGDTVYLLTAAADMGPSSQPLDFRKSTNNGTTWSQPVFIGEAAAESDVQARQQIAAADGRVIVMWQRERPFAGGPLPTKRLGYNRSMDGGVTWEGLKILPGDKILATDINVIRDHHQVWMVPGGELHVTWSHGPPGDPSSPMGYIFSPDYGATWSDPEIAISPPGGNLPYGIAADGNWVHVLAEPGIYVRRRAPPVFSSMRSEGQTVVLEWIGQGALQCSEEVTGPWEDLSGATSPHTVTTDSANRFFRIMVR